MQFSPLPISIPGWIAAATAAALIGMSKAGFGTGAGIVAVPLLTLATGSAHHMLPVLLPVLICGDIFSIVHYRNRANWHILSKLIAGCLIGVGAGWAVLHLLGDLEGIKIGGSPVTGENILNKMVGIICVSFVSYQMWSFLRTNSSKHEEPYRPKFLHGVAVGSAAGLTSTLAHSAGPIIAIFMLPQRLEKSVFVGTVVTYFFVGNLLKLIPFTAQGMFTSSRLTTAILLFPFAASGTLIGLFLNRKIKSDHFMMVLYLVTLIMGIQLLLS